MIKMTPSIHIDDCTKLSIKDLLKDRIYLKNPNDREKIEELLDTLGEFSSHSQTMLELMLAKHLASNPDFKIYIDDTLGLDGSTPNSFDQHYISTSVPSNILDFLRNLTPIVQLTFPMQEENTSFINQLNKAILNLQMLSNTALLPKSEISLYFKNALDSTLYMSQIKNTNQQALREKFIMNLLIEYFQYIKSNPANKSIADSLFKEILQEFDPPIIPSIVKELGEFLTHDIIGTKLDIPDYVIGSIMDPLFDFSPSTESNRELQAPKPEDFATVKYEVGYMKSKITHTLEHIQHLEKILAATNEHYFNPFNPSLTTLRNQYFNREVTALKKELEDLLGNTVFSLVQFSGDAIVLLTLKENIMRILTEQDSAFIEKSQLFKNEDFMKIFIPTLTPAEIATIFSKIDNSSLQLLISKYSQYVPVLNANFVKQTLLPQIISNENLSIKSLYILTTKLNANFPIDETDERKMIKAIIAETYNRLVQPQPSVNVSDVSDAFIPNIQSSRAQLADSYQQFAKSKAFKMIPDGQINENTRLSIKDLLRNRIYIQDVADIEKVEKILDDWGRFDSPARTIYELVLAKYILNNRDFKIYFCSSNTQGAVALDYSMKYGGFAALGRNFIVCGLDDRTVSRDKDTFLHELMHYFEYIVFPPYNKPYQYNFDVERELEHLIEQLKTSMNIDDRLTIEQIRRMGDSEKEERLERKNVHTYLINILDGMQNSGLYHGAKSKGREFIANFAMACFGYIKDHPQCTEIVLTTFKQTLEHFDSIMLPEALKLANEFLPYITGITSKLDIPDYVIQSIRDSEFDFSLAHEFTGKSEDMAHKKPTLKCEIGYLKSKMNHILQDIIALKKQPIYAVDQLDILSKQFSTLLNDYNKKLSLLNDYNVAYHINEKIFRPISRVTALAYKVAIQKYCNENDYTGFKKILIEHPNLVANPILTNLKTMQQTPNFSKFMHDWVIDVLNEYSPDSDQHSAVQYMLVEEKFAKMIRTILSEQELQIVFSKIIDVSEAQARLVQPVVSQEKSPKTTLHIQTKSQAPSIDK